MAEVVEAKVRPKPARLLSLSHANLKPLGVTGNGDGVSLRCRCAASTRAALVDNGTSLELPFLVAAGTQYVCPNRRAPNEAQVFRLVSSLFRWRRQ